MSYSAGREEESKVFLMGGVHWVAALALWGGGGGCIPLDSAYPSSFFGYGYEYVYLDECGRVDGSSVPPGF